MVAKLNFATGSFIFHFGLAIVLNVRSEALDSKGIQKARRAVASGEKNNSLYKVSFKKKIEVR